MKTTIAVIRPERLEAVEESLKRLLDEGDDYRLTVDTVEGHGRQEGEVEFFRGTQVRVRLVEKTIAALTEGARTAPDGAVGDGKVFVAPLEEVVRIRTGERGQKAS